MVALWALESVTGDVIPLTPVRAKDKVTPELFLNTTYLPILEDA